MKGMPEKSMVSSTLQRMALTERCRYSSLMAQMNVATARMAYTSTPPLYGMCRVLTQNSSKYCATSMNPGTRP